MSIRWITPLLGTAPALTIGNESDITVIDVRDLVDKAGNRDDAILQKINVACESLRNGKKTVVCCDYGISRSNAVAAGILASFEAIPLTLAVRRVLAETGKKEIKTAPLQAVRRALGEVEKDSLHGIRSILVTGGSGTLGRPIMHRLAGKYMVSAPVHNEIDLRQGSTELDLITAEKNVDCIVHLANPRIFTSNIAMGETLTMLRNVLDVCVTHKIKLIYLSGWEVYSGYRTNHLMADEALPMLPKGPYAETKYLCEMLIGHFRCTQGLRCTMLRSSPVYGVGSDKPKFIYNFIDKIKRTQAVVTHRYNNGLPSLDLLYIDDLVSAVVQAVGNEFCGDLNVGTGITTSTRRVAEIVQEILCGRSEVTAAHIDDDIACIAMDSSKAQSVLGWRSVVSIEQGLARILSQIQ